jgi:hypothetical protein
VLGDLGDLNHPQRLPGLIQRAGEGRDQAGVTVSPSRLDGGAAQRRPG